MAKIVIDARESGTSTGRYIDKLIEHLHKIRPSGYEFVVLAKSHRLNFMNKLAPSFKVIETPFLEFSFGEQLGLKKQIESLKPDLVHFGMVQQPITYHGRVVTTMNDLTTIRFRNPSKNVLVYTVKQQVYKLVNKFAARKSRIVLTYTEYVKKDIVDYTHIDSKKVVAIHLAASKITEVAVSVKAVEGKQFIMYVGRPLPHKNLSRLIDTFSILQQSNPDLYLVLAGKKDALYDAHESYVTQKGIKNVVFTGFISDGQLRWLYEHTACYVFPSLSEGFGLPGLEAMAHGAPVASSDLTCLPEIYGDAVAYFDPLDTKAMGESIDNIISNKKYSRDLRRRGITQAGKYSWSRTADKTLEAYKRALSKKESYPQAEQKAN